MKGFWQFVAMCCIFVLTFSFLSPAIAQSNTAITQEKATQRVKELCDTTLYDEFNINYSEYRDRKVWQLNWAKSKEPYGDLSVTIDAESGNILDLYLYKGYDPNIKPSPVPKLKEDEARRTAEDFIKKLQPKEFKSSKLDEKPVPEYRPLGQIRFLEEYNFYYIRMENGIPVENDGFDISIDANTGEILRYRFTWAKVLMPAADNIIAPEKAEDIFKDEKGLELVYNRYFDYQTKNDVIKLVYTVKDRNALIDAFTGKIIEGDVNRGYNELAKDTMAPSGAGDSDFTPVEQTEIDATKNCITKEAAAEVVKKYFEIPATYNLSNARLYEAYQFPQQRVWSINWDKEDDSKGEYGSIYARVDAVTSELLSYNMYDDERYNKDFKQKYDVSEAQKKAEAFLKDIQLERFAMAQLEEPQDKVEEPEKAREHCFNYIRLVEGIPFADNGFYICIDAVSGDVINFKMKWQERQFPSPDGVIAKETAEGNFMEKVGMRLAYVGVYDHKSGETVYRLAYKLSPSDSYVFDAFDFKSLDYRGNPIEEKIETAFTDIEGHWAQKDIQLLVDLGVVKSDEDEFRPDDDITSGQFVKLLMIAKGHGLRDYIVPMPRSAKASEDDDIEKYFDAAVKLGWIKSGELSIDKTLSREQTAALLVRAQEFEKVASLSEIYKVPALDEASVKAEYRGHVAITLGLGLMGKSGNDFKPNAPITNAEAATILVRLLTLDK